MEVDQVVLFAFILTLIAGLSTGIGSAIAFFFKRPKMSYLAFALGLSAGVMIYVSFMELMPVAIDDHFHRVVWLNPELPQMWDEYDTVKVIRNIFPMYHLSTDGISDAVQALIGARVTH